MIKRILFFCFLLFGEMVYAQISITGSDYANLFIPGKTWKILTADSLKGVTMNIGETSSTAQVWSLPAVQFKDTVYYTNISTSGTPFSTDFPKATHASTFNFEEQGVMLTSYLFFTINEKAVVSLGGGAAFNGLPVLTQKLNDTLFTFPIEMGRSMVITDTTVNSQGVTVIDKTTKTIDAFGTINLPNGKYDALRAVSTVISKSYMQGKLTGSEISKQLNFVSKFGTVSVSLDSSSKFTGNENITNLTVTVFGVPTSVNDEKAGVINTFTLGQNYPNPFNPATTINYQLPAASRVEIKIFDMLGREVASLVNKEQPQGKYSVKFDGSNLTSGIYFYRLKAGGYVVTKKMQLIK
jgi:hypothetical protein